MCDSVAVAPYRHDLHITSGDVLFAARWGLGGGWGVETLVPLRVNRERITYRTMDGAPFTPDPPDVHHSDRTLSGFADPWLLVVTGHRFGAWSLGARAGVSFPVGSTVEDPFALGEAGIAHEHVQLGSGTVQPIVSLGLGRAFDGWSASAIGYARFGVDTNQHGYRPGDQLLAQAFASSPLGVPHMLFTAGPTLFHENTETWQGQEQSEGNLGRTDLYAEGRVAWAPPGLGFGFRGELRVPVWSEATGSQLEVPVSFRLAIGKTFGGMTP